MAAFSVRIRQRCWVKPALVGLRLAVWTLGILLWAPVRLKLMEAPEINRLLQPCINFIARHGFEIWSSPC